MEYNIVTVLKDEKGEFEFLMNEAISEEAYRIILADQMQRNIADDPDAIEMGPETKHFQQVLFTSIYHDKIKPGCVTLCLKCKTEKSREEVESLVKSLTQEQWDACRIPMEKLENERIENDE